MNKVALPISILVWINTIIVFFSSHLVAHELQPNIVNLQITKDHIRVDFTTNLEAYITGIDFSILDNTNDHDNEKYYGILRTLNKTELSNVFLENWGPFASSFTLISETGAKLDNLTFSSVEIENVDNIEVPRSSTISFTVKNPGISYLTFQASKNLGEIIFRQVGVENGITQYLLPGEKSNNISHETSSSLNGINTFFDYVPVGFTHILPKGLDHILFVSTFVNKIDKKGRVSLPSIFRSALPKDHKNEIILSKSLRNDFIDGLSVDRVNEIAKRINNLDFFSEEHEDFTTSIFSEMLPTNLDREGRFLIPEKLKTFANIHDEVVFIGQGYYFQIVNPSVALDLQNKSRTRLNQNKKTLGKILTGEMND